MGSDSSLIRISIVAPEIFPKIGRMLRIDKEQKSRAFTPAISQKQLNNNQVQVFQLLFTNQIYWARAQLFLSLIQLSFNVIKRARCPRYYFPYISCSCHVLMASAALLLPLEMRRMVMNNPRTRLLKLVMQLRLIWHFFDLKRIHVDTLA